jgi:hypothetical protein
MNIVTFLQNYVKVSISGMFNFVNYLVIEDRFTEKLNQKLLFD